MPFSICALGALVFSSFVGGDRADDHDHDHAAHAHVRAEGEPPPIGFGGVLDLDASWARERASAAGGERDFDARVRLAELALWAEFDERARAYAVLASHELEAPEVEEAAAVLALPLASELRVGHFYVDFGLQMRHHVEALRTRERPLALRALLGEELAGTGARVERAWRGGEQWRIDASLGLFADLVGDHHHAHGAGHDDDHDGGAHAPLAELDEPAITARLSASRTLARGHALALGGSLRALPEFAFEHDGGLAEEGLANHVVGIDVEWTWSGRERGATAGAEVLVASGDLAAAHHDAGTPAPDDDALVVADGRAEGLYAFVDVGLGARTHVGVQWSRIVLPSGAGDDASEWETYVTRRLGPSQRLRVGATHFDGGGEEELAVYVQLTLYLGAHAHH